MMTQNNFFTLCEKWKSFCKNKEIPYFYKQSFSPADKIFIPYDELSTFSKTNPIKNVIPHFFIQDENQVNFASNPNAHSNLLDNVYAVFSTDFSVFTNTFPQFNNAIILLNRLIASSWQQKGRFVIITLTWGLEDTYDTAFSNIDKGSIVGISTEGVTDWACFKSGFIEMLKRIEPDYICWYDKIPSWVYEYYPENKIIKIPKRFEVVKEKVFAEHNESRLF